MLMFSFSCYSIHFPLPSPLSLSFSHHFVYLPADDPRVAGGAYVVRKLSALLPIDADDVYVHLEGRERKKTTSVVVVV